MSIAEELTAAIDRWIALDDKREDGLALTERERHELAAAERLIGVLLRLAYKESE